MRNNEHLKKWQQPLAFLNLFLLEAPIIVLICIFEGREEIMKAYLEEHFTYWHNLFVVWPFMVVVGFSHEDGEYVTWTDELWYIQVLALFGAPLFAITLQF